MAVLGCLGLVVTAPVHALQVKNVNDNDTISAEVSVNELSRIFVTNDRIQSTRGVNGVYELIKDEKFGAIFIKVSKSHLHKPFNLFITTELGSTYTLHLIPKIMSADNIEIKPISQLKKSESHWEQNSAYVESIIHLMNDMINEVKPEGYSVTEIVHPQRLRIHSGLNMQLIRTYHSADLDGEIWRLVSNAKETNYMHPRQFSDKGVLAVSLKDEQLTCGSETMLYRVVAHD